MRLLAILGMAALLDAQSATIKTGPQIGEKIPAFRLQDQRGHWRTFDELKGPKGLVLAFVRSADW